MIGRTLGNYRIIEQIGLGGMATVYKAYEPGTDRHVAIKILPRQFSQDPTFRERFRREAKAIAKLEHLHILPIFAYGEDDDITYMAMRYLQEGTLTDRIKQGPLSLNEAGHLLNQIAGALDYAHQHDILHRDVKPSNVLLDAGGNAFLTDFGIAKMAESTLDLTGGGILGTPAYMSPEQCMGSQELTPASDIYALGIVLYEMVTGRTPFQAETPIALIHMQLNEPLPMPRHLNPNLPEAAELVILKALAKEPESRYQTCGAMATAFAQAIAGQEGVTITTPPGATSSTLTTPVNEATLPHGLDKTAAVSPSSKATPRRLWPVIGLVLLGLVVIAVVGTVFLAGTSGPEDQADNGESVPPKAAAVVATPTSQPDVSSQTEPSVDVDLPEMRWIEPCMYNDRGSGLCIHPEGEGEFSEILKDTSFVNFGGVSSWSPDGSQIVFSAQETASSEYTIYVVNADGSNLTKLPPKSVIDVVWSPDGEWLAFHYEGQLAIIRPDGSDLTILWANNQEDECVIRPQWSPDSLWVAVSIQVEPSGCQGDFPRTREIWVVSQDGETFISTETTVHESEECMNFIVAFSPNSEQVAYIDAACQPQLVAVDGTGEPAPLEEFPYKWTAGFFPQWLGKGHKARKDDLAINPDMLRETGGAMLAARCEAYNLEPGVCVHLYQDDNIIRLFEDTDLDPERFAGQSWSPDGWQLVVSGAGSGDPTNDIYLFNIDGTDIIELSLPGNVVDPVLSPDEEWLAFHYDGQLAIVRPDGSDLTILWDNQEDECTITPQWSPDSLWIVVSMLVESPECQEEYPLTREIWVVSRDGEEYIPVTTTTHESEDCLDFTVAFNPDSEQVAYIDVKCQAHLIKADGSGEPTTLDEYPYEWTAWVFPQW